MGCGRQTMYRYRRREAPCRYSLLLQPIRTTGGGGFSQTRHRLPCCRRTFLARVLCYPPFITPFPVSTTNIGYRYFHPPRRSQPMP